MSQVEHAISSADLLTRGAPAPEWLVEQRLPNHGASLLAGVHGVGKRTLARDLALCVARGRPWLGFPTTQGRVLYAKLDEFSTLRELFAQGGLEPGDEIYFVDVERPRGRLERIREFAKSLEPSLIIVDSLAQLREEDACYRRTSDPRMIERILDLSRESGAHVLMVQDILDSLATDLAGFVSSTQPSFENILMLSERAGERILRTVQRQGLDLLEGIRVPVRDPAREAAAEDLETQILAYLRRAARLADRAEIERNVDSTDVSETRAVLKALHRRGQLIRTGLGTHADPFRYTGFDRIHDPLRPLWLRRVRPWARVGRGARVARATGSASAS